MRAESLFIAERPAAQHCAELLGAARGPIDTISAVQPVAERFARTVARSLAGLCGGEAPGLVCRSLKAGTVEEARTAIPGLAAGCLLVTGTPDVPLLATIEGAAILRMIDRTFGGRGEVPSPLPSGLPPSADLLIARLAALIADALSLALGNEGCVLTRGHGSNPAEMMPFTAHTRLIMAEFAVSEGVRAPWTIHLLIPADAAADFGGSNPMQTKDCISTLPADPAGKPFGDVPLPLTATIIDTRMPLAAIAGLAPGVILPVAVARHVPLRIGQHTIATGTVGSQDDCVALQITALG